MKTRRGALCRSVFSRHNAVTQVAVPRGDEGNPLAERRFQALVFDMDGVILQSNEVKHQALLRLFEDFPEDLPEIAAYDRRSGGVPRRRKFAHIWREILCLCYSQDVEEEFVTRYAQILEEGLRRAPLVDGIREFLSSTPIPKYVSSAAPQEEVERQLASRGLLDQFSAVFGSPTEKADALRTVIQRHACAPSEVLFLGDARADYEAAQAASTTFAGVVRERNDFEGLRCPTLVDFRNALLVGAA